MSNHHSDAEAGHSIDNDHDDEHWPRVVSTSGALYGEPRVAKKRRRCDGHLVDRHWIEAGEWIVHSALPPGDSDIGNVGWWHHSFCIRCAPVEYSTPPKLVRL